MRIEHINLVGKNIEKNLKFYQAAFPHWKIRAEGEGEWYGKSRRWVHFGDDEQYIALSDYGEGENRDLAGFSVGLAHFAFVVDNLGSLIVRLQQSGFEIYQGGSENPFRKNIYFLDNDGFEVEFVEYLSDLPHERNS